MAQETLNPAGSHATPTLPVRLTERGGNLLIDKKEGYGNGRRSFHAEVALSDVTEIRVGPAELLLAGSTLTLDLRDGSELRAHLQLGRVQAESVAELLRQHLPDHAGPQVRPESTVVALEPAAPIQPPPAIAAETGSLRPALVVKTDMPPRRISWMWARVLGMLMVIPLVVALAVEAEPLAIASASIVWLYAMCMALVRAPSTYEVLAWGNAISAGALLVDAASNRAPERLLGTAVCLVCTWALSRMHVEPWPSPTDQGGGDG
jgi:hypothetical protein